MDRSPTRFFRIFSIFLVSLSAVLAGCGGSETPSGVTHTRNTAPPPTPSVTISANAAAIDPSQGLLTVLGLPIRSHASTSLSGVGISPASGLGGIAVGSRVQVAAGVEPVTGELVAASIRVVPAGVGDAVEIQASIGQVNATSFTLAGLTVDTDANTRFTVLGPDQQLLGRDATAFFAQAQPGDVANVNGAETATATILATDVEVRVARIQDAPPVTTPPVTTPPVTTPPVTTPPVTTPPVTTPPVTTPPVTTPPVTTPPVSGGAVSLSGPVTAAFDPVTRFIAVAGIPMHILDNATIRDGAGAVPLPPASLNVGDPLKITGTFSSSVLHLQTIERQASPLAEMSFSGPIASLSSAAQTITMAWGSTVHADARTVFSGVNGAPTTAANFFATVVAPSVVYIRGSAVAGVSQTFLATNVDLTSPTLPPPTAGAPVSAEGALTAVVDSRTQRLSLFGVPMALTPATIVTQSPSGAVIAPTDLALGDSVRVAGILVNDVITLSSVTRVATPLVGVDLNGPVTAMNPREGTITMLGVTVNVDAATTVTDSRDVSISPEVMFAGVTLPASVHVRGMPVADAPRALHATTLMTANEIIHSHGISLNGPVTAVFEPGARTIRVFNVQFTLAPDVVVTAAATGATLTPADIALTDFVRVTGTQLVDKLTASAIQILAQPSPSVELKAASDVIDETTEVVNVFGLAQKTVVQIDDSTVITDVNNAPVEKRRLFGALPEHITMTIVGTPSAVGARSILASSVKLDAIPSHTEHISLIGPITAVNTDTMTLSIFDIPVQITQDTAIADLATSAFISPFQLTVGRDVQALGEMVNGVAYLDTINVQSAPVSGILVHAPMTGMNRRAGTLTLEVGAVSVNIRSDAATQYRDVKETPNSATEFFENTPLHALVHARDSTPVAGSPLTLVAGIVEPNVVVPHNDPVDLTAGVTTVVDATTMMMGVFGVPVQLMPDTVITDTVTNAPITAAALVVGTPVSVRGVFNAGAIHLTAIDVVAPPVNVIASGPAGSINNIARTFSILGSGVAIQTSAATQFFDSNGVAIADFFASAVPHSQVRVTGTASGAATTPTLIATRVDLLP